jgi:sulfur-oxidizing protein SoxZ
MARETLVKTRQRGEITEILCLVDHPMETGQRLDLRTHTAIPAHFIQKIIFEVSGRMVAEADIGTAIARDPVFTIRVKGVKRGDSIRVKWTDNKGEKGGASTTVA